MSLLPPIPTTRALGNEGITVSSLAWGMWRFAGSDSEAARLVHAVLDSGITLFDTADIYGFDGAGGFGDAEALLGRVFAAEPALRSRMVLASKGGIMPPLPYDQSTSYLTGAIDASLKRLGVEQIDLYQIHRPDILTHPEELADTLKAALLAGKIGNIGVSNMTVHQITALASFLDWGMIRTTQPEISPLRIDCFENGELDQAMQLGMTPMAWSPLGGGRIAEPVSERDHAVAAALDAVAAPAGVSRTAAAYSWLMAHPAGIIPIVGTQNAARVAEAADAYKIQWTRTDWYAVLVAARGERLAMTQQCEVSWFSALCDDDYEFLGVPDPALASSWEHCRNIVLTADKCGYDNVLLPSGYALGMDTTVFASAIAPLVKQIRLLMAVRIGEDWPPQLARRIATLDRILGGRLTVNIISSDMPGEVMDGMARYRRTVEVMHILRTMLNGEHLNFEGEFYQLNLAPPRMTTLSGKCPPLYFGGLSPVARETAAEAADVFLMWPDTMDKVREVVADMRERAAAKGRTLKFGYRAHVIVRETESEARAYADRLLSKLDAAQGDAIRAKSLDAANFGVQRQAELRSAADGDGFVEDNLWTGIGRARSGCGAAIVGDPDQVLAKLRAYQAEGMEAFILSGYPHAAECDLFARHVLPHLKHGPLAM